MGLNLARWGGVLVVALTLTACSAVDRVAIRLNSDSSIDFASCDDSEADALQVQWTTPDGSTAPPAESSLTPITESLLAGEVVRLDATVPSDEWVSVEVISDGAGDTSPIQASFDAEDISVGEWAWNQTGIFIGTVDVEHCDLDEPAR